MESGVGGGETVEAFQASYLDLFVKCVRDPCANKMTP